MRTVIIEGLEYQVRVYKDKTFERDLANGGVVGNHYIDRNERIYRVDGFVLGNRKTKLDKINGIILSNGNEVPFIDDAFKHAHDIRISTNRSAFRRGVAVQQTS